MELINTWFVDNFEKDKPLKEITTIQFRLGELISISKFLDLLGIDSHKIRDLYYYHSRILKESDFHYLEYKQLPIHKKQPDINKLKIIEECGDLPLFDSPDIF